MSFENWTIEDLIARCTDFDEMTLEMDREEFAALRRKITELKQADISPVIPEGYVMVPKEPTDEMIAAAMNCDDVLFNSDESFCVQFGNIYEAMLAAAPQSPGSEPAAVPGKWIPVSERVPDCWCRTCRPVAINDMRFVVCPDCGNKRCPRANDHRNACTGSNEPGQEGSAYPAAPQEVK
ncbi:hypothetical protein [Klebsiella variicola]|uniref:hypothetical protein n=1 Tax=Klebsiella variicola TaxID=244366 RepID=UPI002FE334AD